MEMNRRQTSQPVRGTSSMTHGVGLAAAVAVAYLIDHHVGGMTGVLLGLLAALAVLALMALPARVGRR